MGIGDKDGRRGLCWNVCVICTVVGCATLARLAWGAHGTWTWNTLTDCVRPHQRRAVFAQELLGLLSTCDDCCRRDHNEDRAHRGVAGGKILELFFFSPPGSRSKLQGKNDQKQKQYVLVAEQPVAIFPQSCRMFVKSAQDTHETLRATWCRVHAAMPLL